MKKSVDEKSAERGRGGEERHELVWRLWGMKEVCTESTEKEVEIPVDEKEKQCEDRKQSAKWEGEKMRGEEGEREEREGRKEGGYLLRNAKTRQEHCIPKRIIFFLYYPQIAISPS